MDVALYIMHALLLLLLCRWLWRKTELQSIKAYMLPALALKLLSGVLLGLLYHHYYREGDTLTFEKASHLLTNYAYQNPGAYARLILFNAFESEAFKTSVPFSSFPGFSNSFYFIKLLSFLNLLTNSQYYINALYLSVFSFWGAATLAATLVKHLPKYKTAAVLAFLYFPSVVFWSSGVLKDAILFGSMCWVVAAAITLAESKKLPLAKWLMLPVMLYLFVRIKLFMAFLLLPLLILYVSVKLAAQKLPAVQSSRQIGVFLLGCGILGAFGLYLVLQFNNAFFFQNLVDTYQGMLALSEGKPHITYANLQPSVASIAMHAPKGLFSAVYRPFLWEGDNLLYLLMSLENLFILALSILAVISLLKNSIKNLLLLHLVFVLLVVLFGVVIGLSTPNFGTLSRYRIAFLPFLVYLLLQNRFAQKLLSKLRL